VLAAVTIRLWTRHARRDGAGRWVQRLSLALSLLIVFPVISLTDDLQVAQNPALADCFTDCQRREHAIASPHSIFPAGAALPASVFAGLSFGFPPQALPYTPTTPTVDNPALASIQNRPPPAA
jgi:hypothetical protein